MASKLLKLLLIGLAAALAVLLAGVFVVWKGLPTHANSLAQYGLEQLNKTFTGNVEVAEVHFDWRTIKLDNISLKLDSGEPLLHLEAARLDLHWFRALKRADYMALPGDLALTGLQAWPELDKYGQFNFAKLKSTDPQKDKPRWPWEDYFSRYEGKITLDKGEAFFRDYSHNDLCAQIEQLSLSAVAKPDQKASFSLSFVPVQKVNSFAPELGLIKLNGKIKLDQAPDFSANLSLSKIDLARTSDYFTLPKDLKILAASLESQLWAECKATKWSEIAQKITYGGTVKLKNGSIMLPKLVKPVEQIGADIEICPGLAIVKQAQASLANTRASAHGKIYIWSPGNGNNSKAASNWQGRMQLTANVPSLRLNELAQVLNLKIPVEGTLSTDLSVEGPLGNPEAKGHIHSKKLSLPQQNQDLNNINIDLSWKDKLLTLEKLTAQAAGGQVQGDGYVLLEGSQPKIVFNLSGQGLSLAGLSPVGGRIDNFKISMAGTPEEPFIYGQSSGVGGFTGSASMLQEASARFVLTGDTVSLNNVQASTGFGRASIPYASYNFRDPFLYAWAQADNMALPPINVPTVGTLTGNVSGLAGVVGSPLDLNSLSVWGLSNNTNLHLGSLDVSGLHGAVGFSNMSIYFPQMQGYAAGGQVEASGWLNLQGGGDVSLSARNVSVAPFAGLLRYDIPLKLDGVGDLGAHWTTARLGQADNWLRCYLESSTTSSPSSATAASGIASAPVATLNAAEAGSPTQKEQSPATELAFHDSKVQLPQYTDPGVPEPTPTPLALANTAEIASASPYVSLREPAKSENLSRDLPTLNQATQSSLAGVSIPLPNLVDIPLLTSLNVEATKTAASTSEAVAPSSPFPTTSAYFVSPPQIIPYVEPGYYAAAADGFAGRRGLGFVGWASNLALDGRKLTSDLCLDGRVTGRFGIWGSANDFNLAYMATLEGSPIALTKQNFLWVSGTGRVHNKVIDLNDNLIAWNYLPHPGWKDLPRLESAGVYPFLGPEMARPLRQNGQLYSWAPKVGLIKLDGSITLGAPLSYQLTASAQDIDIQWLHGQQWLPIAAKLLDSASITSGHANAYAKVASRHGLPEVLPGSWVEVPQFVAGSKQHRRSFSAVAALSSTVGNDPKNPSKPALGAIKIDELLVSSHPNDERLPNGRDLTLYSHANNILDQGLLEASGVIDNGETSLTVSVNNWSTDQAVAFVPNLAQHNQIFNGWLSTDKLQISLDSNKDLMHSWDLDGTMSMHNGGVIVANTFIPIDSLKASVDRDNGQLIFSDVQMALGGLLLQGSGRRKADKNWQLDLFARDMPFADLTAFKTVFAYLQGHADMALHLETEDPNFKAIQLLFAFEGKDVVWNSTPASLAFPDFRIGTIEDCGEAGLRPDSAKGVSLSYRNGRVYLDIPPESAKLSIYRYFDKALLSQNLASRTNLLYEAKKAKGTLNDLEPDPEAVAKIEADSQPDSSEKKSHSQRHKTKDNKDRGPYIPLLALNRKNELLGVRVDKEPLVLSSQGSLNFSPDFGEDGFGQWFAGPNGPEFGKKDGLPLTFNLENFQGNIALAALGLPPNQRHFSFSGSLGLKGQWYHGHLLDAPVGALEYSFNVADLTFGSFTADNARTIQEAYKKDRNGNSAESSSKEQQDPPQPKQIMWRGLTLKNGMKGGYKREEHAGRLIIEPFEFVPQKRSYVAGAGEEELHASGTISGSANIALTRRPRMRRNNSASSAGSSTSSPTSPTLPTTPASPTAQASSTAASSVDVNELHLNISQLSISELGSFLFPGLDSGFVENFILNASGPVTSPAFNMLFNVTNAQAGSLKLASIAGAMSGSRDPQTHKYQVRFGKVDLATRNQKINDVVNKDLKDLAGSEDYENGIKVYFGPNKRADRFFSIFGTLPYEVSYKRSTSETKSLVPFWQNVTPSFNGILDITAELRDKDLGLVSSSIEGVKESSGNLRGDLHIGGTVLHPEIVGKLKLNNGMLSHEKIGKLSNLDIEANFSEITDPDLNAEYTHIKKRKLLEENGIGALLTGDLPGVGPNSSSPSPAVESTDKADAQNPQSASSEAPAETEEFHFSRIDLQKFTGTLGDRSFEAKGQADMDGLEPLNVDFSLKGNQLPLRWGDLFEGRADVDLHLSKADVDACEMHAFNESLSDIHNLDHSPKERANLTKKLNIPKMYALTGDINIPNGDLSIGLDMLTSSSTQTFDWSKLPVDYRVNLNIGEDVWMRALGSRVRASGNLAIVPQADTGKPVMEGTVNLSRGVLAIPLYDLSFKVRSGKAVFNKTQMPELQGVTADASVNNYEITAFVNGSYPDIKVDLVSNPPLAEKEIKNLLALGGFAKYTPSTNQINQNPMTTTGSRVVSTDLAVNTSGVSMLSRLLASPLTQEIGRMLFLSDFTLDVASPHAYSLKIAKAIDQNDKFLFTLTRTFNSKTGQNESIYGVEWRFRSNMLVRLGVDEKGSFRPWFHGFWEF